MTKQLFLLRKATILLILSSEIIFSVNGITITDIASPFVFLKTPIPFLNIEFGKVIFISFLAIEGGINIVEGGMSLIRKQ